MQLAIRNVLPTYFNDNRKASSEIWGKDLQFDKGEFIKIVAPSGSGKTSLMHFLYGLRHEYNGRIFYDDRLVSKMGMEDMALCRKEELSIVFQDLRLFPEQTVEENIGIKRQLKPFHPPEKIGQMTERL